MRLDMRGRVHGVYTSARPRNVNLCTRSVSVRAWTRVRACLGVCMCTCACERDCESVNVACEREHVRAYLSACEFECAYVCVCVHVRARVCTCACASRCDVRASRCDVRAYARACGHKYHMINIYKEDILNYKLFLYKMKKTKLYIKQSKYLQIHH